MAIKIPAGFSVATEPLDPYETYVRDQLGLNIGNWARFRRSINIGNVASRLVAKSGFLPREVKQAYRELGKSHYEVILALGHARLSVDFAVAAHGREIMVFSKSCADFYFHAGRLVDNIARLIYIVNDSQSATALRGKASGRFQRHWIDWGSLGAYPGYRILRKSKRIREITNVRNVFAHSWSFPNFVDRSLRVYWPVAIRRRRDFFWPQEETPQINRMYRKRTLALDILQEDFRAIEDFQSGIFARLTKDVRRFENANGVTIT